MSFDSSLISRNSAKKYNYKKPILPKLNLNKVRTKGVVQNGKLMKKNDNNNTI